jgi:hypothetical protein
MPHPSLFASRYASDSYYTPEAITAKIIRNSNSIAAS